MQKSQSQIPQIANEIFRADSISKFDRICWFPRFIIHVKIQNAKANKFVVHYKQKSKSKLELELELESCVLCLLSILQNFNASFCFPIALNENCIFI